MSRHSSVRWVFIVGYPRSGTTLVQSVLARDPRLTTVPETFFFRRVVPAPGVRKQLGFCARRAGEGIATLLRYCPAARVPAWRRRLAAFRLEPAFGLFREVTTTQAIADGARVFLEKTPMHVLYIDEIQRACPDASIIHVVRNPVDAIASLRDVSLRHPGSWHGDADLKTCTDYWIECATRSRQWCARSRRNRLFLLERVIADPAAAFREMAAIYGSDFAPGWLQNRAGEAVRVTTGCEPWKARAFDDIRPPRSKAAAMFDDEQRELIRNATGGLWAELRALAHDG